MLKSMIFILVLISISLNIKAQCFIKSSGEEEGFITFYLEPELVAQTDEIGVAMSVQMVGQNYYLALTYQFKKLAVPVEEKVALELQNGYTLELEMYTMEVANAAGVELCLAVFNLNEDVIPFFTKSKLKMVHFKTQEGTKYAIPVTKNIDVLIRQLKCFGL